MSNIDLLKAKMNNGNNDSFIELYGTDVSTLKKQAERYSHLLDKYKASFNSGEPEFFSSPGRTEIGGNHTDHNHGRF